MPDVLALCRDCGSEFPVPLVERRCGKCDSSRIVEHRELRDLAIAHLDCDAFYAAIEKRDNPALRDKPVLVGGAKRGVVMACCYIARRYGIRSAMPMRRALERCPHAVVVKPDMRKYRDAGRQVRELMFETTPRVEPLSVDEAFLDLSGTEAVHGSYPARVLVNLVGRIERDVGVTASIGLSYNKFLAKIASDLEKPRGFSVIGRAEAVSFLTDRPVSLLWGVGPTLERRLNRDGIFRIGQIRETPERTLVARYGKMGHRLARFAIGQDRRAVHLGGLPKSVSAETTFQEDIADAGSLLERLWPLCERVSDQLKKKDLAAGSITVKLKTARFRILTRGRRLAQSSQFANDFFAIAKPLVESEAKGQRFRLIGIGARNLVEMSETIHPDLFGPDHRLQAETVVDSLRERFGTEAVGKGRGFSRDRRGS